jgi:hypothetical protein
MNDDIEPLKRAPLKPTRHLATQAACCHWAPIIPVSVSAPDGAGQRLATPKPAESAAPPVEKKPD